MRILFFTWRDIRNQNSGGAEILTQRLSRRWVKLGHQVSIFSSWEAGLLAQESIDGVKIIRRGGPIACRLWAFFYYRRNFKGKFDLVIDQVHGLPFFAPFYTGVKTVAFPLEVAGSIWDYEFRFPLNLVGKLFENIYIKLYKSIPFITISASTKTALLAKGVKSVTVIPLATDVKPIDKIGPKSQNPTVIVVGRIVRMKRIEEVLAAFQLILAKIPSAKLWVVGPGDPKYLKLLKTKEVVFWGKVTEEKKIALLKRAWLLVSASVREGWGLVVTEAAACGTPAVVYNVPGLRDSVKNNKTGIICNKNTPNELANQIIRLIENHQLRRKLSVQALEYSRQFDWDRSAKETLAILVRLAGQI